MKSCIITYALLSSLLAVNSLSADAIHNAIRNGDFAAVKNVVSLQKETMENDITPLFLAVDQELSNIVQLLLDNAVAVNKKMDTSSDYKGWTALHLAASRDNGDIVDLLLKAGAQKNLLNAQGKLPVALASDIAVKNKLE